MKSLLHSAIAVAVAILLVAPMSVLAAADEGSIEGISVSGFAPASHRTTVAQAPAPNVGAGINVLSEVPAFDWCYGSAPTAAAMLMGYYDRHGYPNMYAGSTNGGVCPLDNSAWGHTTYPNVICGECPFAASHQGIDGRTGRGHVDDYWVDLDHLGPDPYSTGGWTEHSPMDCLADFMGANLAAYGTMDGEAMFYFYSNGAILCDYIPSTGQKPDGCHGMKLFALSRGYTVSSNCSRYILGYNGNTQGFTFAQYCAEIDAGRPALIHLVDETGQKAYTVLGYGYNTTGSVVYIHDTTDYDEHQMTWGGAYEGWTHRGVTSFQLTSTTGNVLTDSSAVSVPEGGTATFKVKLSMAPTASLDVTVAPYSGDSDITVQSGGTLTFTSSNYNAYQTVTLAAAQDADGIDGTATIRCTASGWGSASVAATEADDDRTILVDMPTLTIPEGGSGILNVKLKSQPTSSVTIAVARYSGDSDISVKDGSSLTFTTSNWDTYQPATIAAAQDADGIDDTATVRCTAAGWAYASVGVTAIDDDALTIAQMKRLANGSQAVCREAIVTAVFGDSFYAQDSERTAGIRVNKAGHGLSTGALVSFAGAVQTGADGERFVVATSVSSAGTGTAAPLGLTNRAMGGGDFAYYAVTGAGQKGVAGGFGTSNIGLLVRTSGAVVESHPGGESQVQFWSFDTDPGWTLEGQWAWGVPAGGGGVHGKDPTSGYTGTNVVGYNLSGDYPSSMTATHYAATPPIDCSGVSSVKLRFRRWLGVETASYDHASIQASTDGTNWTDVWANPTWSIAEAAWSLQEYDISAVADGQPAVYLRWGMGPTDGSVTYAGWNLDDVEIAGAAESYIVIDDGSGANVRVTLPTDATAPTEGGYVAVTGISSCEKVGDDLHRLLKVRTADDINE